ncbi:hypothetical protein HBI67_196760 [Parastagonospora nodorum]|nr:hypothetical protein HBH50_214740 [Parastagonospora nodorum]KAH4080959.1 hypothetical protein HBH48_204250 [Parastagonospora nodorum]KAH6053946.1 hypothetical protein HBI66_233320 [Parastagonospora nodorum]KAH6054467.1 hypothetical protein HBI67_196760 [Parastagonospora nodorum]
MSGIEIAGLVLGSIPLLIQVLKTYRESAEVFNDWWRIERAYKKTCQDLDYHEIIFGSNVKEFLLPLVANDDELRVLMDDPAGEAWENADLEVRLRQRLPNSYELFLAIIGDINDLVDALKKELGVKGKFRALVAKDGKLNKNNVSRSDLLSMGNLEFQAKRIKFTMRKSSREKIFAQLEVANERMRKLLESSDRTSAARLRQNTSKASYMINRKINEFWRHAKRLHEALATAWRCGCANHITNLGLEHRTSDKVEFDVLFHLNDDQRKVGWQGTRIKMVTNDNALSIQVPQPGSTQIGGRVRFDIANAHGQRDNMDQKALIKDLCSVLNSTCPDCLGFLQVDEHRFELYPWEHASSVSHLGTVSLEQLLSSTYTLTRHKRYSLALTLASSYLQLSATPWLNPHLRKKSIVFLEDPTEPGSARLDQPYICEDVLSTVDMSATDTLSCLGIRLLELCFGVPIEATKLRKQFPPCDAAGAPQLDYAAAIRWSRLVAEEAGPEFAEAVKWCLHTEMLSETSWRTDLWQHVIVPLEACQLSQKPNSV